MKKTLTDFLNYPLARTRLIRDDEVEAATGLINEAYSYQDAYKPEPRISVAKLREKAAKYELYVIFVGSELAGTVCLKREPGVLHIGPFALIPRLRGQGLGEAVMQAIEAYGRELGVEKLELDYMSISPWLKPYYERLGYRSTGEVTDWGTIDLIQMVKLVD